MPHSDFGDPDCWGCLNGVIRGEQGDIVCNECGTVVRTVPSADLQRTFDEMELTPDICTEMCPHCEKVNVIAGFSQVMAFTCSECGQVVKLSGDPDIERFFG